MSFSIDFSGPLHPIVITLEGVLTADEFVEIMEQIVNSKEYPSNINAVYDLTHMSFDNITIEFLQSLKVLAKKFGSHRRGAKTAYVCPKDLQFGMARIWEVFVSDLPLETMVTRSMDEALSWIQG
ncbi:MAG: hypothetical protein PHZ02_06175 [Desulfocapsaceae bacterium]|nr:hypothetical protein [Desulfocapsaceae bacterium]